MRPLMGAYYLKDETNILRALWRAFNHCKFVEEEDGIVFFQRKVK